MKEDHGHSKMQTKKANTQQFKNNNNVKEGKNIILSPSYFWTRGMEAKNTTFRV